MQSISVRPASFRFTFFFGIVQLQWIAFDVSTAYE